MPKKPKPPSTVHVDVTVVPAAALPCHVSLESGGVILRQDTNADGWCRFNVPREWRNTQLTVLTDSPDYGSQGMPILLDGQPHEAPGQFWVTLTAIVIPDPPQPPVLDAGERGPLHIDGLAFKRQNGSVFPWRGSSEFSLFQRFCLGEDLNLLLDERIALGANILRVFGMFDTGIGNASGLGPFRPTWADMDLHAFLDLLASRGLRCEFTVFADAQVLMPDLAAQRQFFTRCCNVCATHWNAVVELVNEPLGPDASKNGVHPKDFTKPTNVLAASGKYDFEDGTTTIPSWVWDWTNTHSERKPEWPRTPRSSGEIRDGFDWANGTHFPGTHSPVVQDEPTGAAETPRGDSRSSTASDFRYYSACAMQMGAGATFHSDDGIASRLFASVQKDCARAFFEGLIYIPNDCQFAPYCRGGAHNANIGDLSVIHHDLDEPEDPAALRTFQKMSGGFAYYNRERARGTTGMNPTWIQVEEPYFGIGKSRK